MIQVPSFAEKRKLFDWLVANKSMLLTQKKSIVKHTDAVSHSSSLLNEVSEEVMKSEAIPETATRIKVRFVANTTKLFDSHGDVHIDQLWNKSIKENKDNFHVKMHQFDFEGVISDNVKVFAKQMAWGDLGYAFEGQTQALLFDSIIDKAESPYMFEKYRQGKIKQHSVGMRYIKVDLAINDDRYEKEFELWQKYIDMIVNKTEVMEAGYFYPVTEAKLIEGSAVLRGSNYTTPTLTVQQVKQEPSNDTLDEPARTTLNLDLVAKFYQPLKHI